MREIEIVIFTVIAAVILVPFLYFLPAGLSLKGKFFLLGFSIVFSLLGVWASEIMPMWKTISLLILLLLLLAYVLANRLQTALFAGVNTEEELDFFSPSQEPPSVKSARNVFLKKQIDSADQELPSDFAGISEQMISGQHEMVFVEDKDSGIVQEENILPVNNLAEENQNIDLVAEEIHTEEQVENSSDVFIVSEGPLEEEVIPMLENLEDIQIVEEESLLAAETDEAAASLELPSDDLVSDLVFIEKEGGQEAFISPLEEILAEMDEEDSLYSEELFLMADEEKHDDRQNLKTMEIKETDIAEVLPTNGYSLPIEESAPIEKEENRDEEEWLIEPTENVVEESEVPAFPIPVQAVIEEMEWMELAELEGSAESEAIPSEPNDETQWQKQLVNTFLEHIRLTVATKSQWDAEAVIKSYLNNDLSAKAYYVFSIELIQLYIRSKQFDKLEELLVELQSRFDRYPMLLVQLNYITEQFLQNSKK